MTKSSSGAKCKVLQVQVRVEVAPALSGRESGRKGVVGGKGRCPPKTPAPRAPRAPSFFMHVGPPLWKLSLSFGLKLQKPRVPAV